MFSLTADELALAREGIVIEKLLWRPIFLGTCLSMVGVSGSILALSLKCSA